MSNKLSQAVGLRISELRRAHKMTQESLAELLNVSTKHISHVERGVASLSLKGLIELSNIFKCSLDYIIFGETADKAYSVLPETIIEILHSGNEESIDQLCRYLQIYAELYNQNK